MSADLRRAAELATPGPWRVSEFGDEISLVNLVDGQIDRELVALDDVHELNANYIAAASPDVILALLDERDTAIRRAEEAEALLSDADIRWLAQRAARAALRSQESQKPPADNEAAATPESRT